MLQGWSFREETNCKSVFLFGDDGKPPAVASSEQGEKSVEDETKSRVYTDVRTVELGIVFF